MSTYRQYNYLSTLQINGFDFLKVNLASITPENFTDWVFDYIEVVLDSSEDPVTKILVEPIPSIILNAYSVSNFNNENVLSPNQKIFVQYANDLIQNAQLDEVEKTIQNTKTMLNLSGLSSVEKNPLFLALELALSSYTYWDTAMSDSESPWYSYFGDNSTISTLNLKNYTLQTYWGVLYGYNIGETNFKATNIDESKIGSSLFALIGALSVTPSRILFKEPQTPVINFSNSVGASDCGCDN